MTFIAIKRVLACAAVALVVGVAAEARAVEIYFNGVQVTGLRGQAFQGCAVRFDEKGNVYISAPGYNVKRMEEPTPPKPSPPPSSPPPPAPPPAPSYTPPPPAPPTPPTTGKPGKPIKSAGPSIPKTYFLFSKAQRAGYAQYDVDVYINGKWAKKVRNSEGQILFDITDKLKKGKNVIHFAATKNYGGKSRLSDASSDLLQVFVGAGTRGGGTVNIVETLAAFKATAATTNNYGEEQVVQVE